jgi:hypothetical protein
MCQGMSISLPAGPRFFNSTRVSSLAGGRGRTRRLRMVSAGPWARSIAIGLRVSDESRADRAAGADSALHGDSLAELCRVLVEHNARDSVVFPAPTGTMAPTGFVGQSRSTGSILTSFYGPPKVQADAP